MPPLQLAVAGGARQFQRGWPKVMVLGREVANSESEGGGGRRPFLEEGRRKKEGGEIDYLIYKGI